MKPVSIDATILSISTWTFPAYKFLKAIPIGLYLIGLCNLFTATIAPGIASTTANIASTIPITAAESESEEPPFDDSGTWLEIVVGDDIEVWFSIGVNIVEEAILVVTAGIVGLIASLASKCNSLWVSREDFEPGYEVDAIWDRNAWSEAL